MEEDKMGIEEMRCKVAVNNLRGRNYQETSGWVER
jgi:hypothetical protein